MVQKTFAEMSQSEKICGAAREAADYIGIKGRWPEPIESRFPLFIRRRQAGSAFTFDSDGNMSPLGPTQTFIHIERTIYWLAQDGRVYTTMGSSTSFTPVDPSHFDGIDAKLFSRVMNWLVNPDY